MPWRTEGPAAAAAAAAEGYLADQGVNLDDVLGTIVSKKREIDRLEAVLREAKASIDEQPVIVRRAIRVKKAEELSEVEGGPEPARRVTPKPAEEESPKSGEEVTPGPAPAAEPTESAPEAVEGAGDDPKHGGEGDDEEDGDAVEEDEESDGPPPLLDAQEEDAEEEEDEGQKSHEPADQYGYSILCTAQGLGAMGYVPEDVGGKIKYCGHYVKDRCCYGASCKLRHPEKEKELKPRTKKVLEICRHFYDGLVRPGSRGCTFGSRCRFSHDIGSFAARLVERGDAQEMEKGGSDGDDPKHGGEADDEEDGDAVEEDEEGDGPPPRQNKSTRRRRRRRAVAAVAAAAALAQKITPGDRHWQRAPAQRAESTRPPKMARGTARTEHRDNEDNTKPHSPLPEPILSRRVL